MASEANNDKFAVGTKARVLQPKLLPSAWTITEIIENRSFTWQTRSLGVTITAKHYVENMPNGTATELKMTYEGFLANTFYRLSAKLTQQYLTMEIKALKSECKKTA